MAQAGLDFGRSSTPPRPRAARARTPLVGGRTPVARQASADGAALNAPNREHQVGQLLRYLESKGMHGATDAEIERDLEWPVNVITARRNDLYADGLVMQRWPKPRRNSVRTGVAVIVTVATSVVRTEISLLQLRGRQDADAADGPAGSSTSPSSTHEYEHRTDLSGPDVHRGSDRAWGAGRPGEPAGGQADDRGARIAAPSRASAQGDAEGQPQAQSRLTPGVVGAIAYGTRVVLADGRHAQVRMVTRKGEVVVFVFSTRDLVSLAPDELLDYRAVDGELRQIKECV